VQCARQHPRRFLKFLSGLTVPRGYGVRCAQLKRAMKSICSILILMIAAHSQCSGQCLSADLYRPAPKVEAPPEQPPCHQHAQNLPAAPSNQDSSRHEHDKGNSCGQAQTSDFKIAPVSKTGPHLMAADFEFDVSPMSLPQVTHGRACVTWFSPLSHSLAPSQQPVLRI
jgi:hypothetical protein